ncbi:MAG: helix-turn-helix domain-containing protein [Alphaproteobacteria bacterium]|nr:helix-turn-helix domain-containing protein [Alphaproteobacteria bacterium]
MSKNRDNLNSLEKDSKLFDAESSQDVSLSSTLIRGIEILQCFTSSDRALTNAEIARRLGFSRPTVSRLCKTLVHIGYLRRDTKGAFQLAPKMLALNYPVLSGMPWRYEVLGPIQELADMCGGAASICVMSVDSFVHVQTTGIPPAWPYIPDIGQTGPLHRSASGWSLLSMLRGQRYTDKIAQLNSLHPKEFSAFEEKTNAAISRCHKQGFCVSYGDWRPSLVATAAPLGITDDGLCVSIALGLPSYSAVPEHFETDLGPRIADAAEALRGSGVFSLPDH